MELGAFLQAHAPGGGHDPNLLQAEHVERYVAEVRRRERLKLPTLTLPSRGDVAKATTTPALRQTLFNGARVVLRAALENGSSDRIGLARECIVRPSGHRPQRAELVLFPSIRRSRDGRRALSYNWFQGHFRAWIDELDLGSVVPHQARHTLATRLLRHGASLTHIRRYLGHVSDRMAEHYAQVAVSEIEDVLQHVWVAGPGAANPGELLSSPLNPLDRRQAEALAIDLSRRSTPTEGGFCTFQPVVDGGACPFNLDCENCDKFVMSGADLLYWHRKREQWHCHRRTRSRRCHRRLPPRGLRPHRPRHRRSGEGPGRTQPADDALALDLRRPQDYFHRLWSIGFRAGDLARAADNDDFDEDEEIPA